MNRPPMIDTGRVDNLQPKEIAVSHQEESSGPIQGGCEAISCPLSLVRIVLEGGKCSALTRKPCV